jgi:hypothetical protein
MKAEVGAALTPTAALEEHHPDETPRAISSYT